MILDSEVPKMKRNLDKECQKNGSRIFQNYKIENFHFMEMSRSREQKNIKILQNFFDFSTILLPFLLRTKTSISWGGHYS